MSGILECNREDYPKDVEEKIDGVQVYLECVLNWVKVSHIPPLGVDTNCSGRRGGLTGLLDYPGESEREETMSGKQRGPATVSSAGHAGKENSPDHGAGDLKQQCDTFEHRRGARW